jgi:predicted O-linked N-acetylglucosamine transferase (SPINDLY family)
MIDICLDPFPYAGTTTTAEALYMGVPCLTMRGNGHAHNVGVSMITHVGLGDEWIAESKQDYINKAKEAASNIQALGHLRSSLRSLMSSSPVCNVSLFMDNFERKLSGMWDDYLVSPSI